MERTLQRAPPHRSRVALRMLLYSIVGGILLGVYEMVFLARTSINRDWNHLHNRRITQAMVEQAVVRQVQQAKIYQHVLKFEQSANRLPGKSMEIIDYIDELVLAFGLDSSVKMYETYFNWPLSHSVLLVNGSSTQELSNLEKAYPEIPLTSSSTRSPAFHAYSGSGNATGRLIYANYGTSEDFQLLKTYGVPVSGSIVLIRTASRVRSDTRNLITPGSQVWHAQEHGAAAVLLFPDVKIAESLKGSSYYPVGHSPNPFGVPRDTVLNMAYAVGDPTTVGWPSLRKSYRTKPKGVAQIPTLPISTEAGILLLRNLGGQSFNWTGENEVPYTTGPSGYKITVDSRQDYAYRPIYNILARIPGVVKEEIIVGASRDGFTLGFSGGAGATSALLEIARILGGLRLRGWVPYRTIVLAFWDGGSYGGLGATEFVESYTKELTANALAYINLNSIVGSEFHASCSPLLLEILKTACSLIPDPETPEISVCNSSYSFEIPSFSSNSAPFQYHLGIPTIDFSFDQAPGAPNFPIGTNYETAHWHLTEGHGWKYHAAIAQIAGLTAVMLANYAVLPLSPVAYTSQILYVLEELLGDASQQMVARPLRQQKLIFSDATKVALMKILNDSHVTLISEVFNTAERLLSRSLQFEKTLDDLKKDFKHEYPWYKCFRKLKILSQIKLANFKLFKFERAFLSQGLYGRAWFKHIWVAPGRRTGLPEFFPTILDAIEDDDAAALELALKNTREALESAFELLG